LAWRAFWPARLWHGCHRAELPSTSTVKKLGSLRRRRANRDPRRLAATTPQAQRSLQPGGGMLAGGSRAVRNCGMQSFEAVWNRIVTHAGRPFVTDDGREFHYEIEPGDQVRFSCWRKTPATRESLAQAWEKMPCDAYQKLPAQCAPRKFIWTILKDTRISQRLPEDTAKGRRQY